MLIFFFVIIGLSVLILGHEAGHFVAAKFFRLKVDEFGFGFPPRIWAWKPNQEGRRENREESTVYSINALPFGGFVRIAGESDRIADGAEKLEVLPEAERERLFYFQPAWKRALVTGAGVAINFVLGWFLLTVILMIGLPQALIVSDVQPGSPAEAAGILSGDAIVGFKDSQSFVSFVNENKGKATAFTLKRNGEEVILTATPRAEVAPGEGALGVLFFEGGEEGRGFFAAIGEGFKRSLYVFSSVFVALFYLVNNLIFQGSLLAGVVGPVGVFAAAYDAGGLGFLYLAQIIAAISLNLAAVNLIPFPALDGGRLLLILVEKLKGSPISRKVEAYTNGVGFAFLIALMVMLTVRDIGGLF